MKRPLLLAIGTAIVVSGLGALAPISSGAGVAGTAAGPTKVKIAAQAKVVSVVLGTRTAVVGKVTPAVSGLPVVLQDRIRGRWSVEQVTRIHPDGSFLFAAQPRVHGITLWRVTTPMKSTRAVGKSPVFAIRALVWTWLNTLNSVGGDGSGWSGDPADADGVHYAHSIVINADCYRGDGGVNWREWDLGRNYTAFEGTVSMRDDAPATTQATYAVIVDGQTLATGSVKLGVSSHFQVNVARGLRLHLEETNPAAGESNCTEGNMVWGDVKLLG